MASEYTKLPAVKIRVGNTADFPDTPPSKQAAYLNLDTKEMFVSVDMQRWHPVNRQYSTDGFSNPPTSSELDLAFGTPSAVGANFTAIIDNGGNSNNVYLIVSAGTSWWIAALNEAV